MTADEIIALVNKALDERLGKPDGREPVQRVKHAPSSVGSWGKPARAVYCSVYRSLASIAGRPDEVTCRACLQQIGRTVLRGNALPWPVGEGL